MAKKIKGEITMTQADKELLLRDLCARLPYGVKVYNEPYTFDLDNFEVGSTTIISENILEAIKEGWKPYLRPMSSMTEDEMDKIEEILGDKCIFDFMGNGNVSLHQGNFTQNTLSKLYDFYNSIHVDYRGLIPKGLALEAPEGMYKNE